MAALALVRHRFAGLRLGRQAALGGGHSASDEEGGGQADDQGFHLHKKELRGNNCLCAGIIGQHQRLGN
jgi:hypothetical protein